MLNGKAESATTNTRALKLLAWILFCGLILRLALLVSVGGVGLVTDDEKEYVQLATSLEAGRGFAFADGRLTSIRPPLYPAAIAALWEVSGRPTLQVVRGAQIVLSLGSVVLLFLLAQRLFGSSAASLAAAGWCFYPSFLYAGVLLLTEVQFTFFVLAACLFAVVALQRHADGVRWALAAGASIGLAALTRSVVWPLPFVLAPVLAALSPVPFRRRLLVGASLVLGYALVIAPWAIRNTMLQRTFVAVDTMGGLNLRMGNFEHTLEDRMWDGVSLTGDQSWSHAMVVEHPDASYWTEGQREKWARQRATEYIVAHPLTSVRRAALKFADFWGLEREYIAALRDGKYSPPGWFKVVSSVVVLAAYVLAMVLACLALLTKRLESDWRLHVIPMLVLLWVCGIHTVVFGHSRYHLPIMPIVLMYSALAVHARSWRHWRGQGWQYAAAFAAVALFACIWFREIVFRDPERIRQLLM